MDWGCPRVWARFGGMKTMQMKADELVLTKLVRAYADEGKARELLESWHWPNGPVCPHCQNAGEKRISKLKTQSSSPRGVARASIFAVPAANNSR